MPELLAAEYVGLSVSTIGTARARRDFPEPVQLTPSRIVYLREDLNAYLDRKAGRGVPLSDGNLWMQAP